VIDDANTQDAIISWKALIFSTKFFLPQNLIPKFDATKFDSTNKFCHKIWYNICKNQQRTA